MKISIFLILLLTSSVSNAQFSKGNQIWGLRDLGIGYSSVKGWLFSTALTYQFFLIDNFSIGASSFYTNALPKTDDINFFGGGPSASYYFKLTETWFSSFDQDLALSKYNGSKNNVTSFYGTSGASLNHIFNSGISLGIFYKKSYALDKKEVLRGEIVGLGINVFR
jgi:hypothetical protein